MEIEEYQGFTVHSEARGEGARWYGVRRGDEYFEFSIHIAPPSLWGGDLSVDRAEFAERYGRRWVRGMIDLGRYQSGRLYREIRAPEWNPVFGPEEFAESDVRQQLLTALDRLARAEAATGRDLEVDFEGIALVLNLDIARVLETLHGLTREGLVARVDGGDRAAHRITDAGRATLARMQLRPGSPADLRGEPP